MSAEDYFDHGYPDDGEDAGDFLVASIFRRPSAPVNRDFEILADHKHFQNACSMAVKKAEEGAALRVSSFGLYVPKEPFPSRLWRAFELAAQKRMAVQLLIGYSMPVCPCPHCGGPLRNLQKRVEALRTDFPQFSFQMRPNCHMKLWMTDGCAIFGGRNVGGSAWLDLSVRTMNGKYVASLVEEYQRAWEAPGGEAVEDFLKKQVSLDHGHLEHPPREMPATRAFYRQQPETLATGLHAGDAPQDFNDEST